MGWGPIRLEPDKPSSILKSILVYYNYKKNTHTIFNGVGFHAVYSIIKYLEFFEKTRLEYIYIYIFLLGFYLYFAI